MGDDGTVAWIGSDWGGPVGDHPLVFRISNTERMRIDKSGNVGIGTTDPQKRLVVNASNDSLQFDSLAGTGSLLGIDANGMVYKTTAAADSDWDVKTNGDMYSMASGNIAVGYTPPSIIGPAAKLSIGGNGEMGALSVKGNGIGNVAVFRDKDGEDLLGIMGSQDNKDYLIAMGDYEEAYNYNTFRVEWDKSTFMYGKVGIGTETPSVTLDVKGETKIDIGSGKIIMGDLTEFNEGVNQLIIDADNGTFGIYDADEGEWMLKTDGNRAYAPTSFHVGTDSYPSIGGLPHYFKFSVTNTTGNNIMGLFNGTTNVFIVDENGKVGIGTETPSVTLDVKGETKIDIGSGKIIMGDLADYNNAVNQLIIDADNGTFGIYDAEEDEWLLKTDGDYAYAPTSFHVGINSIPIIGSPSSNAKFTVTNTTGNNNNNIMALFNNTTNVFTVDKNGKVGIGTDNPTNLVDIHSTSKQPTLSISTSSIDYGGIITLGDDDEPELLVVSGANGGGDYDVGLYAKESLNISTSKDVIFYTDNDGPSPRYVIIKESGRVGIGTYNPTQLLDVQGAMHLKPGSAPSSPTEGDIYMDATSHKLRCYDGSTWKDLW
ncbi:MAG: hypothetical protein DSY76_00915 [Bacteroidetes bacterium]|nr:MAG: hypothetical protein DSY76_00915 [Bacteroidota bacterium]